MGSRIWYTTHMQHITLEQIKEQVVPVLQKAEIKKAALFGSYVRGDNSEQSDIDMLVAFPEKTTLIDVVHLQRQLEGLLDKKVDLVSYNAISPLIRDSILNHQYPLL